ncbi:MAG: glycosyltransferase [Phycisphaerae bacterium]|nr:glycosyltransferase [Phycisphaerae bacterium]
MPSNCSKIRVLHVVHSLNYGGIENFVLDILRYSDPDTVRFDICTVGRSKGPRADQAEQLGSRVLWCPLRQKLFGFPVALRRPYAFLRKLTLLIRHGNYDIVHSHVNFMNGMILRAACLANVLVRISHVYTTLDWSKLIPFGRPFVRCMRYWINKYSTHKFGDSKQTMANVYGDNWANDSKCRVHHCGINSAEFLNTPDTRQKSRSDLGISDSVSVIGHVGRFNEPKNHAFLIDVFAELSPLRPDVLLLLVGDGQLRTTIQTYARQKGLSDRIVFAGSKVKVSEAMAAMDVFVFPSLYESLPLAVLEAQASGLPCLVSEHVTNEVDLIPDRVRRLSLGAGAGDWAKTVDVMLDYSRTNMDEVELCFNSSTFPIRRSVEMLNDTYLTSALNANKEPKPDKHKCDARSTQDIV